MALLGEQPSYLSPEDGSTAATFAVLYAEQNPNIGTLLEHTGIWDGRVPVAPARFADCVRKKW